MGLETDEGSDERSPAKEALLSGRLVVMRKQNFYTQPQTGFEHNILYT